MYQQIGNVMAEVVQDFDWNKRVMRDSAYPWDEWFNGSTWLLTKDIDFEGDLTKFRRAAYAKASYHGFNIQTRTVEKERKLLLRKLDPSETTAKESSDA
jgi:hypothetical protein